MHIPQSLYEGMSLGKHEEHGLITYMRTDSLRISTEAQESAKETILTKFGDKFYPAKPRVYKSKGSSQDAHEAIRPTDPSKTPDSLKEVLSAEQYRSSESRDFIDRLFDSSVTRLVANLYDSRAIDRSDLDELRSLLDRLEEVE